jgi:cytoskeleton protein RodZ
MQQTDVPASAPRAGPGALLRSARLDLKLAPEDVAQILHLSPRQIVALEADDYAHLPGPTYVRGYLRGYAQLLGLAPETVVDAYNRIPAATPQVDLTKLSPEPQISSDHHMIRIATYGVIAVVFGLAVVWWLGRDDTHRAPATGTAEAPATSMAGSEPIAAAPSVDTNQPGVAAPMPPSGETTLKPAATPAAIKPLNVGEAPAAVVKPVGSAVVAAPVPSGPRSRVVLAASQDAWVDIRDAQQNKLIYETLHAGQTVSLEGLAPLSVFLGNADGVKIEYNGKPFDTAPFKHGLVARFTLGAPPPAPEPGNVQR